MTDKSPCLSLPYILPSQAQKHVTHNDSIRMLDALVQLSLEGTNAVSPPVNPEEGVAYGLASSADGVWSGQGGYLAVFVDSAWTFHEPQVGWLAWDKETNELRIWDGTNWIFQPQELNNLEGIGIGASYDSINKLVVQSSSSLLNHNGQGHQLVVNKAADQEIGALLFQTGFSGRAEVGLIGSDDFSIKTSSDGSNFQTAILADGDTGEVTFPSGVSGLSPSEFGNGSLVTVDYSGAKGLDLMTNGTGLLGNTYNFPAAFEFESVITPNLPGGVRYSGHYSGAHLSKEFLPLDPNRTYKLQTYIHQETVAGDWASFSNEDRHIQYMGLVCYDADLNQITASNHMRFKSGGVDSLTTLAQPLSPGDTVIHLADASGWNDATAVSAKTGFVIFEYKNNLGYTYSHYSRLVFNNMFDVSNVDKSANTITLNAPLGSSAGNPDDSNGTWPIGTRIANSETGNTYKYSIFEGLVLDQSDEWFRVTNHIGGIDRSGLNVQHNFPPGTAYAKVLWLPNYSNRVGGYGGFPDTGNSQKVRFSGVSITPKSLAVQQNNASGDVSIFIPKADFSTGNLLLAPQAMAVEAL